MTAVGDARKRQASTPDAATLAGRDALHAAADALADLPAMAGVRVWLDVFAGGYQAGER